MNVFFGLIVVAIGLIPYFEESYDLLKNISVEPVYNWIIVGIGVVIVVSNLRSRERRLR